MDKGDLPAPLASSFLLVMPFSRDSEHAKLMTSLIIDLLGAFYSIRFQLSIGQDQQILKNQGRLEKSRLIFPASIISLFALPGHIRVQVTLFELANANRSGPFIFEAFLSVLRTLSSKTPSCTLPCQF